MRKFKLKICSECRKMYLPTYNNQKQCSADCRISADQRRKRERQRKKRNSFHKIHICGREEVIRIKGVSRCRCGYPLAPCSVCESCDYATCPYGCNGTEEDTEKPCDHDALPDSIQEKLYALL